MVPGTVQEARITKGFETVPGTYQIYTFNLFIKSKEEFYNGYKDWYQWFWTYWT